MSRLAVDPLSHRGASRSPGPVAGYPWTLHMASTLSREKTPGNRPGLPGAEVALAAPASSAASAGPPTAAAAPRPATTTATLGLGPCLVDDEVAIPEKSTV